MEQINLNTEVYHSIRIDNDIPFQLKLPLQIGYLINNDDPVWTFNEVMKGVNLAKYLKVSSLGREPYNPFMMLKVILFSEMLGGMSLRELEDKCRNDIRFIFLADEQTPSHNTFANFINHRLKDNIKDIFLDINCYLIKVNNIDTSTIYIDGTKIEANANKYTFVWKKTALKTRDKRLEDCRVLFKRINKIYNYDIDLLEVINLEHIDEVISKLIIDLNNQDIELVYGSGKRKTILQRDLDTLVKYLFQLYECIEKINICGEDRNSYSKTDHSATMMHMKEDYYSGTNLFKAGYNVQLGVSDEYIMNLYVCQDRNDQNTLIPFLDNYTKDYGKIPDKVVADAGYGSYDNYMYLTLNQRKLYIKFIDYSREKSSKYKRKKYLKRNWKRDAYGNFICPEGYKTHLISESENTKGKYTRINYTLSTERCSDCPVKELCTKSPTHRTITHNPILEEFENEVRKNLSGVEGKQLKDNRSYQSEGAFGVIKNNNGKVRFRRRGMDLVTLEMTLTCIGYNLMKYHNKKTRH